MDELTDEQRNSINMLNYLTVLVQEINSSSNSRLFLEEAYSELYNNTEPSIVDDLTLDQYESIMDTIVQYRMVDVKREHLDYIYEQQSADAIRAAVPNPMSILNVVQSGDVLKSLVSVAYLAVDAVTSYQSYTESLDLQYLQDGWALDETEEKTLYDSRASMFAYMVRVARDLPAGITLSEDNVTDFVKWENEPNVTSRIQWLEANRSTYQYYGGYWLTMAQSYYEKAESGTAGYYEKCLSAIDTYESLDNSIFRKDSQLAQTLPCAIEAAREVYFADDPDEYVQIAARFAKQIEDNTGDSDWTLRYFAAQTYIDIYTQTQSEDYLKKAYDIVYNNVNIMRSEQASLNSEYKADVVEKSTSGLTKDEKDQVKEYNKLLKEKRKTELAPVYEPLRLNLDLLFALADELNISAEEKNDIDSILHPNGQMLFLNPAIDNLYYFSSDITAVSADQIDLVYTTSGLVSDAQIQLPAEYVSDNASIVVTIANGSDVQTYTDWTIASVDRNKSNDPAKFTATYTSHDAKSADYNDGATITVTVTPFVTDDNSIEPLVFTFKVSVTKFGFVPTTHITRVM